MKPRTSGLKKPPSLLPISRVKGNEDSYHARCHTELGDDKGDHGRPHTCRFYS